MTDKEPTYLDLIGHDEETNGEKMKKVLAVSDAFYVLAGTPKSEIIFVDTDLMNNHEPNQHTN